MRNSITPARVAGWTAGVLGLAAGGYAVLTALAWRRYGRVDARTSRSSDALLDRFMPRFDVVERHHIGVDAPPEVTLAAACEQDLMQSPLVRAIFATRAHLMCASGRTPVRSGLLAQMRALGWGDLAAIDGRAVVLGAVTRPWQADVVFRAIPPEAFAGFAEPGYVKIAWTLRADPDGEGGSVFSTETRAIATDEQARARFRRYWSLVSPGVALIRLLYLRPVRRLAEGRARAVLAAR